MQTGAHKKIIFCLAVSALLGLFSHQAQSQAEKNAGAAGNSHPTIRIADGALIGTQQDAVTSFKGVPYATAPVGRWRWREPQPVNAWKGLRDATRFGNACVQKPGLSQQNGGDPGKISEDCLYLNVWTSNFRKGGKSPVMVWIHGGGLVFGSGGVPGYGGESLAKRGVVVVGINYRMGPLGFFSHPALDGERNGINNFGLLDQIAALKWVQKNISAFGGDAGNVTVFGQSAGAESVLALYASPLARGLFHKGIAQSPYGIPSHTPEKAGKVGVAVASALGLDGPLASAEQLRAIPAARFGQLDSAELTLSPGFIVGDKALPVTILETFQKQQQAALPLIIGSNSDEASVATAFGVNPAKVIEGLGKSKVFVKPLYPKVKDERELGRQVIRDTIFTAFARRISYLHSQKAPVWRYYFDCVQEKRRGTLAGAPHGGEIAFTMDTGSTCQCLNKPFTAADAGLSRRLGDSWTTFARTGNPQTSGLPEWQQDSVKRDRLMEFAETVAARKNFMQPRINALILGLKAAQ